MGGWRDSQQRSDTIQFVFDVALDWAELIGVGEAKGVN